MRISKDCIVNCDSQGERRARVSNFPLFLFNQSLGAGSIQGPTLPLSFTSSLA